MLRNEVTQDAFTEVSSRSARLKKKEKKKTVSVIKKKGPLFARYNSSDGAMTSEIASFLQPRTITMAIYLHLLPFQ